MDSIYGSIFEMQKLQMGHMPKNMCPYFMAIRPITKLASLQVYGSSYD